jgi:hypothetical protein
MDRRALTRLAFAALVAAGLGAMPPRAEAQRSSGTVDCIVAVVDTRIITLTDVRLAEAFGVFDVGAETDPAKRLRLVLDRLIDQKVIVGLARENLPVGADKVEKAWTALIDRIGREEAKRRLEEFGAGPVDLLPYVEEKLLSEAVVEIRFSRGAPVSLKEIETYYAETFGPARKALNLPIPPLIEVAAEIEADIRRGKTAEQRAQWVRNLREQAEIEIRPDCLKVP